MLMYVYSSILCYHSLYLWNGLLLGYNQQPLLLLFHHYQDHSPKQAQAVISHHHCIMVISDCIRMSIISTRTEQCF